MVTTCKPPALYGHDLRTTRMMREENRLLRGTIAALRLRSCQEVQRERDGAVQISMLREANENLVIATCMAANQKSAAELANERQTAFLTLLAHELRNPVASISFANSLMHDFDCNSAKLEKLTNIVARQSSHLVRLVDDLLDVSRMHTGKLALQLQNAMLSEIIDSAIAMAKPMIQQRKQIVDVSLPDSDAKLRGDPIRLAQLFSNLLQNASKFSPPETTVYIGAVIYGESVSISVRDQGKGIEAKDAARIFDIFEQGPDEAEHVTSGGLGVGLALVRTIAAMHGGSVSVSSPGIGLGSEFTVVLPLR